MKKRKTKTNDGLYLRGKTYWMNFTADGLHFQKSTGTGNLDTARIILDRLNAKITLGLWHQEALEKKEKPRQFTFRDLAQKHDEWAAPRHKGWQTSGRHMSARLVKHFGDMLLSSLGMRDIEQFQSDELARGRAPGYINRQVTLLKAMLSKAVDWELADDVLLKRCRKAKQLKGATKRLRYLSVEESLALIAAADVHLRPILVTALNTGMRKAEILSLKWEQVDLKHGFIHLEKTKNGDRRDIPINEVLRSELQSITRRLDIPFVFSDLGTGKPYGKVYKSFASALRRAEVWKCTKCDYQKSKDQSDIKYCPHCNSEVAIQKGIQDCHLHDLRHTFASHLIMAGVDITTVSRLLGHKSLTMTLRYAHLSPAHNIEAVNKIGELFGRKDSNSYNFSSNVRKEFDSGKIKILQSMS